MIEVQVSMPTPGSMRYIGAPLLTKKYGIYSLQLTTPSGIIKTFQLDQIEFASEITDTDKRGATYRWPLGS